MKTRSIRSLMALALLAGTNAAFAQGTGFTYQGRLNDGGNPANKIYDLRFMTPASGRPSSREP